MLKITEIFLFPLRENNDLSSRMFQKYCFNISPNISSCCANLIACVGWVKSSRAHDLTGKSDLGLDLAHLEFPRVIVIWLSSPDNRHYPSVYSTILNFPANIIFGFTFPILESKNFSVRNLSPRISKRGEEWGKFRLQNGQRLSKLRFPDLSPPNPWPSLEVFVWIFNRKCLPGKVKLPPYNT